MSKVIKWIGVGVMVLVVAAIAAYKIEQTSIATSTTGYTREGAVMQVTICKAWIYICSRTVDYNVRNLDVCLFVAAIAQQGLQRLASPWYETKNAECVAVSVK
ncbi:hypothetical protein [Pseudomonas sp. G3-19]